MDEFIKLSTAFRHTYRQRLIKSYWVATHQKITNSWLNRRKKAELGGCSRCLSEWVEGHFSILSTRQRVCSLKSRRLVEKLKTGEKLTKGRRKRAKWCTKKMHPVMEFKCAVCGHRTTFQLKKPVKELLPTDLDECFRQKTDQSLPVRKKKKKKKDIFAGLKIPAVKSTSSLPCGNPASLHPCIKQKTTKQEAKRMLPLPSSGRLLLCTKSKHLKKFHPSIIVPSPAASKTQKNNALLHLAKMLKNNNSSKDKSSSRDRLTNLLR